MRKLKLYIETSGWNFYFADDAPEKMDITKEFFALLDKRVYEVYISEIVIKEIMAASDSKKMQLFNLIKKYSPKELSLTEEAEQLAKRYIDKGIVPVKKWEDALHVAIASVEELDAVISWNYKHMANMRKSELFYSINLEEGYIKPIQIVTPTGVMNDED